MIETLVEYWRAQTCEARGQWMHPEDAFVLDRTPHPFNLDFPAGPFVGDVLSARVLILNANGGFDSTVTPKEFPDAEAASRYVENVRFPSAHSWTFAAPYYRSRNYWPLIRSGDAAVVNACAYRSVGTGGLDSLVGRLPSAIRTRRWLIEAAVPAAARGERLIVAKRMALWKVSPEVLESPGVIKDPNPRAPNLGLGTLAAVQRYLST
jgi:hypothetical protein